MKELSVIINIHIHIFINLETQIYLCCDNRNHTLWDGTCSTMDLEMCLNHHFKAIGEGGEGEGSGGEGGEGGGGAEMRRHLMRIWSWAVVKEDDGIDCTSTPGAHVRTKAEQQVIGLVRSLRHIELDKRSFTLLSHKEGLVIVA